MDGPGSTSRRGGLGSDWGGFLAHGWWGRGYAIEAGRALLAHAFETMGADRLISLVKPGNERSARVAVHLGMEREGQTTVLGEVADVWAARPLS